MARAYSELRAVGELHDPAHEAALQVYQQRNQGTSEYDAERAVATLIKRAAEFWPKWLYGDKDSPGPAAGDQ